MMFTVSTPQSLSNIAQALTIADSFEGGTKHYVLACKFHDAFVHGDSVALSEDDQIAMLNALTLAIREARTPIDADRFEKCYSILSREMAMIRLNDDTVTEDIEAIRRRNGL